MKRLFVAFALLSLISLFVIACDSGSAGMSDSSSSGSNGANAQQANVVHMGDVNFKQSGITIKKGESVTLVDDSAMVHIITNGMWMSNGDARPEAEPGAPKVNLQFQGNDSQQLGPFNTAGSFHFYCTVHNEMNLTVVVR